MIPRATIVALALALFAAAPAGAATSSFVIRGAGFGHGVGMSQYGAMGYAEHGATYRDILDHYYTGTQVSTLNSGQTVRVLLQSQSTTSFTGATKAAGRRVTASKRYGVRVRRGTLQLLSPKGRVLARAAAPLRVTGRQPITLLGRSLNGRTNASYRGALEMRPSSTGGVNAINAVAVDDYVQGVVPVESPSSWPIEALKAQAVAARTYALTTSKGGDGFDQYPDTRSQVYGGFGVEQASTNVATESTAGQVVTYQGAPVVTYFFSTSGGQTEDVENSLGGSPKPWLVSVDDPYDSVSPRHRWGPITMSLKSAGKKLAGLVKGKFQGIEVTRRGVSPRVMTANVIGSKGTTAVTGATLRLKFGLYDTWSYFTSISSDAQPVDPAPVDPAAPPESTVSAPPTGGIAPPATTASLRLPTSRISGRVIGSGHGSALLQKRGPGGWSDQQRLTLTRAGRYAVRVTGVGDYRVQAGSVAGPVVHVR